MDLRLKRIILFTENVDGLAAFYRDVIGLQVLGQEPGWIQFDAGACAIALHHGRAAERTRGPKLVFYAADVAAAKATLARRGFKGMGPVKSGSFDMCDGRDPDGNPIQLSSRT
jgi:catechol-2,3-dioxygenase